MAAPIDHMARMDEVCALIEERLRIRARTLDLQLRKARRFLPKAVQRDAHYLAQAGVLTQNPKLARMIDATKAERAYANVMAYMKAIEPGARRKDAVLRTTAVIALNLLLISGVAIWYLWWKGYV